MTKKNAALDPNSDLARLEVEEREAEVRTKKARAEKEEAEAHRKKREAGIVDEDPELDDKLSGGIVRERFVTIFRKIPGESRWPFWKKHVPLDEIDSIEEFLAAEGDPRYEHKVVVHNEKGKPVKKPIYFPATEGDPGATSQGNSDREIKELERQLAERRKARKAERLRRRLEEEDEEEEGGPEGAPVFVPHLGVWAPPGHPLTMGGMMPGIPSPWMQPKEDTSASLLKALVPVLVAWIGKPQEKSELSSILPLLVNKGQLEPKDMVQMLSPFVLEMNKMTAHSQATLMEGMQQMDTTFRKKVLDLLLSDPSRTPDEIEKWQKWLSFGETALRKAATVVRDATAGGGKPHRLEQRKPPAALPGPKKEGNSKPAEGGGNKASEGAPAGDGTPAQKDPKEAAAEIKKQRVEAFLLGVEEEVHAESEPEVVAEAFETLYLALPKSIRAAIEDAVKDDPPQTEKLVALFATLKDICPEVTERLVGSIMESEERQDWVKEFLVACAFPDEDEEEEEGAEETGVGATDSEGPEEDPGQ